MKRACVIGWPIKHSRSPLIHGYWLKTYGIEGSYEKQPVHPDIAPTFFRTLVERGFIGCNVTVPLKEIAFRSCNEIDIVAAGIGAVNTLWLADGKLHGTNTDHYGFMTHFHASAPAWLPDDGPIAVLGAGGAARAIIAGLALAKSASGGVVPKIRLFNRTLARAEELAYPWQGLVEAMPWERRVECTREVRAVINTTILGMAGAKPLDFPVDHLPANTIVADIVYVPLRTELLKRAEARGLVTVDGLGMLLHQAVPGFEKWFGVRPEVTGELRRLLVADIEAA